MVSLSFLTGSDAGRSTKGGQGWIAKFTNTCETQRSPFSDCEPVRLLKNSSCMDNQYRSR
jgi:hypothetical protein